MNSLLLVAAGAYLIGCISPGYLIVRLLKQDDIRNQGSGGTGARNAARVLGRSGFAAVFAADCLKGAAAVWIAQASGTGVAGIHAAMLAAVLGHIFPFNMDFRGGKGASTAFGALLVGYSGVALATLSLTAVFYLILRRATASGIAVIALLPVIGLSLGEEHPAFVVFSLLTILLLVGHRDNVMEIARSMRHRPSPQTQPRVES